MRHFLQTLFILLLFLVIGLVPSVERVDAYTVTPSIMQFTVAPGGSQDSKFDVENNEEIEVVIETTAYTYNVITTDITNEEPFIKVEKQFVDLKPNGTESILFTVSVPATAKRGTYFNVIAIEDIDPLDSRRNNLGVHKGVGVLVVINVADNFSEIEQSFVDQSDIKVEILDRGIPFIKPSKFSVTYTNNSNFVFSPTGELKIIEKSPVKINHIERVNESALYVHPGETIQYEYEVDVWNLSNIYKEVSGVVRIQILGSSKYIEANESVRLVREMVVFSSFVVVTTVALTLYLKGRGMERRSAFHTSGRYSSSSSSSN